MPNGGSDCCGTCWFNSINDKEQGYQVSNEVAFCTIRDLKIPSPFWTYCANHPHHNRKKIDLPLGPVYVNDGYPYSRKIWVSPPDNEQIRLKLLELLDEITNKPEQRYPSETDFEEEVIKQITALKETRAIEGLKRIIGLDIEEYRNQKNFVIRNKAIIVGQAIEALLEITNGEAIEEVKHFINKGIEGFSPDDKQKSLLSHIFALLCRFFKKKEEYNQENDNFAAIRYHLVRGLEYSQTLFLL